MSLDRRVNKRITTTISWLLRSSCVLWLALLSACQGNGVRVGTGIVGAAPEGDIGGFTRASPGWVWQFPRDHGPHNDFQTEWWYYTGNLQTADGRRFGFQLTFFRRALLPPVQLAERASDWGGGQVYMAHFAISDIGGGQFFASERLSRGAAGLAGAQGQPYQVWLEDWQVQEAPGQGACKATLPPPCMVYLKAANGPVALALRLLDAKGPVLQGDQGFSRKGAGDGQASYYYSLTRLQANGTVTVNGQEFSVTGSAWMDHEFSTSALQKDQVGWDWFSIQLEDGREMMVFQIRRADGTIDPFSSGAVIEADGRITPLQRQDFSLEVTDTWQSRASGAEYPSGWRLRVAKAGLDLTLSPLMKNQELNVSYAYWEGAVLVGGSVAGVGYVELTGYSGSMGGEF